MASEDAVYYCLMYAKRGDVRQAILSLAERADEFNNDNHILPLFPEEKRSLNKYKTQIMTGLLKWIKGDYDDQDQDSDLRSQKKLVDYLVAQKMPWPELQTVKHALDQGTLK